MIHLIIHPIIRFFKFIITLFKIKKKDLYCKFCTKKLPKLSNGAYFGGSYQYDGTKWICDPCYLKKYKDTMFYSINEQSKAEKDDKQLNFDETILDALRKRQDDLEEERQKIKTSPYLKEAIESLLDFSTNPNNTMLEYCTFNFDDIVHKYWENENKATDGFRAALIEEFLHLLSSHNIKVRKTNSSIAINMPSLKEYIERLSSNEKIS